MKTQTNKILEAIEELTKQATVAKNSLESAQYTQAVLNLTHALHTLKSAEQIKESQ